MRLIQWFLYWWKHFLGFPYILGEITNKIQELGIHQTELGRSCICQTQNLRKSIYFTWVMNKSVCESFLDEIMSCSTLMGHIQPSLEIWFETKHFEILSFRALGLDFRLFTSWAWNDSRTQFPWIFEICKVDMDSNLRDEQNIEIILNQRSLFFQPILCQNSVFAKIEAKLAWHKDFKLW